MVYRSRWAKAEWAEGPDPDFFAAVRKELSVLSPCERQILALQFGAQLSKGEIAELLYSDIERVERQLGEVLAYLKEHLSRKGLYCYSERHFDRILERAIMDGYQAPSGLKERILQKLHVPSYQSSSYADGSAFYHDYNKK